MKQREWSPFAMISFSLLTDDRDYNAVARLTNSSLLITGDSQLVPLRTQQNEEVEDFPETQDHIDRLSCGLSYLYIRLVVIVG